MKKLDRNDYIALFGAYHDRTLDDESGKALKSVLAQDQRLQEEYAFFQNQIAEEKPFALIQSQASTPAFLQSLHRDLVRDGYYLQDADIRTYTSGKLPFPKQKALHKRMDLDRDFAAKVEQHLILRDALQLKAQGERQVKKKKEARIRKLWQTRLIAYAACLLLLIPAAKLIQDNWQSTRQVAVTEWAPEQQKLALLLKRQADIRTQGGANQLSFTDAFTPYEKGAVAQSLPLIQEYLEGEPHDQDAWILYAIGLLEQAQNSTKAIELLECFNLHLKSYFFESYEVKWYLALAYLQEQDCKRAKRLLLDIQRLDAKEMEYPQSCIRYQQKAKQLNQKLGWHLKCF
ncbi:MAG: hypothetical protein AAFP19_02635 [Bacteroidota bacterium]